MLLLQLENYFRMFRLTMLLLLPQILSYNSMELKIFHLLQLIRKTMEPLILLKELILSYQQLKTRMDLIVICIQILRINFKFLKDALMLLTINSNLELIKTRVSLQLLQIINFSMLILMLSQLNRAYHLLMKPQLKMIIKLKQTLHTLHINCMVVI